MVDVLGRVRRALLSVFDKTGLVDLAAGLHALGVQLLASGGTAAALREAGIPFLTVEALTGAPEILGGRVKTLHPRVHGGILADRGKPEHLAELRGQDMPEIDLVVCNLYPFDDTLLAGKGRAELIEKIDIGGPTLIRAAAKNVDGGVTVLCDPTDYPTLLAKLRAHDGVVPPAERRRLSAKAFRRVADYDLSIAAWCEAETGDDAAITPSFARPQALRYGENPHQLAALYSAPGEMGGVAAGTVLQGKALSYNNFLDMDAAYRAAHGLGVGSAGGGTGAFACAIVKHTNPCGLALAPDQTAAFERALAGDPVSAFGSVIGFDQDLTEATAAAIKASKLFVECIAAPGFSAGARAALATRENLRLLQVPPGDPAPAHHAHRIGGGLLVQAPDRFQADLASWRVVTKKQPDRGWREELAFAMEAAMLLKSNAIACTRARALVGAGAGQMSRVDACEQALKKAGNRAQGAFVGSDAFFPFPDCVELCAKAGVVALIQPGGSKRDNESIAAADASGLCMLFTDRRHFRH